MTNDKDERLTDSELDKVVGGYEYNLVSVDSQPDKFTLTLINRGTGKQEIYSGKDQGAVMEALYKENAKHGQKSFSVYDKDTGELYSRFEIG